MFKANDNFAILPESYLFSEVARKIREFREANPDKELIRMDIGDVSLPLPAVVVDAMRDAATQMGRAPASMATDPSRDMNSSARLSQSTIMYAAASNA